MDNNKNTDHTLATAYTALTDAVISNHALAGQIFEIAAPALSKFDPLDNAFIHAGQTLYTCIKFCPEKTKDLINICLADIEKNGISDLNTFLLTKYMKKHSLDEIVQSHPQHKQALLAENQHAEPLDKSKESLRFVREVCFLDIDDMSKVSEKCFPEGDQRLQRPDNMDGLVLVDNDKGIVGYCLYDKDEKSIYDMAVLPEYRTDENASSRKLFAEVVRKIKEIGGEWKGEFREGTSYRYLSTMQQRGLVSFENNGVDHVMSDGSHVYKVKFKINDTRQKSAVKQNVVPLSRPVHEK